MLIGRKKIIIMPLYPLPDYDVNIYCDKYKYDFSASIDGMNYCHHNFRMYIIIDNYLAIPFFNI